MGMFRTGSHRIAITTDTKDSSKPIKAMVTQTDIVRFIHKHLDKVLPFKSNATLKELGLTEKLKKVYTATVGQPLYEVFQLMASCNISAVPIVDEKGVLVASLSAANIRSITPHTIKDL